MKDEGWIIKDYHHLMTFSRDKVLPETMVA